MSDYSKKLTEIQQYVTQMGGTEPPFSGKLLHHKREGIYTCLCCKKPLFTSQSKFDSGCGWPSFYQPIDDKSIIYLVDKSNNMERIEIRCGHCNAHLGHVFDDGPQPTGERYCVNSVSLGFIDNQDGSYTEG